MKKSILTLLGAGLLLTSCQSDEPFAPVEGGEKQVTFTLNVPGELGTRAGDTNNASDKGGWTNSQGNLSYTLVLRADNDVQTLTKDAQGQQVVFNPTVVLGRNYTVTAYAYFGDTAKGSIDAIAESKGINDETKDAYTWTGNINFATDQDGTNQNITLKRPYAKLRLIATDYNAAKTDVKSVTVEYKNQMYTMFNAVEGQFNTERAVSFTNQWSNSYYEAATTDGEKTIFADYVPVNEIGYAPFTVTVEYQNGETYTRTFAEDIPVRRNALTTLKGAFFTAGATINVNVVDNFENEQLIEKRVTVTSADELTHAIATATDNSIIYFNNDITGNATAIQKEGIDVIIDGRGFKYDGTITVNGDGGSTNPETLTFQNINFYTNKDVDTDFTFISAPSKINDKYNYSHNVTIQNCTFESYYPYTTAEHGSASFTGTYNFVMKNCTAKNMHSLLQTQSCDNKVLVENVTTEDCKNGVSFGNTAFPTLRNSTIEAAEYGVRADGNASRGDLKIENTTVKAKKPVIVRKMTTNSYNVALNGADLQTAELYHVVFTKDSDDVAYVAPTGTYTLTGAEDYNVYPREIVVRTEEQLVSALNGLTTFNTLVKLIDDITITTDWDNRNRGAKISVPVRIDGQGHTLKFTGALTDPNYSSVFRFENDAEVKNLKIDLSEINARCRAISAKQNLVIDECEFIGNANYNTRGIIYGEGQTNSQFDASITITNSKFTNWKRGLTDNENAKDVKNVVVKGTIFSNAPVYISAYETITFVNNTMDNTWVNITSYTSPETLKVNAVGNSLDKDYSQYNVIGSSSKKFSATNVEAQNGFTVFYAE